MWHQNNKLLTFILIGLLGIAWYVGKDQGDQSHTSFNARKFSILDTSKIDRVIVEKPEGNTLRLIKGKGGDWSVNDQYEVADNMRRLILAAFQQMEVRRPVSENMSDSVANHLKNQGTFVTVKDNNQKVLAFYAGGDPESQQSYFLKDGENKPYIIAIPGYNIYLTRLFETGVNEWRDKTLFNCIPQNLQTLNINYSPSFKKANNVKDIKISYENDFFNIEGLKTVDSAALINYLGLYKKFTADRFLLNEEKLPDESRSLVKIELNAVDTSYSATLNILDARIQSGQDSASVLHAAYSSRFDTPVLIDGRKVMPLLANKEQFKRKKGEEKQRNTLKPQN